MFETRSQMVFGHFNNNHEFLPSPEQILFAIILAQINEFASDVYEDN